MPFKKGNPYRFPPGNNANPNGRPKGKSLTAVLNELLARDGNREKVAQALLDAVLKNGDVNAMKALFDRVDGAVPKEARVQHEGRTELRIRWGDEADDDGIAAE